MNPYLETVLAIIYAFVYALLTILRWVTYPLKPVWYLFYVCALPFIYIGRFFSSTVAYPARRLPGSFIETLYIYLATAALLGLFAGLTLYFSKKVLQSLLQLSPSSNLSSATPSKPAKRSLSEFRASQKAKQENLRRLPLTDLNRLPLTDLNLDAAGFSTLSPRSLASPSLSPSMTHSPTRTTNGAARLNGTGGGGGGGWSRRGLWSSHTIMEEGDSDEFF